MINRDNITKDTTHILFSSTVLNFIICSQCVTAMINTGYQSQRHSNFLTIQLYDER
jgi:hypothetical protein